MKFKILAGETLGTRSLATFVECSDLRILIDPGVALGPRFGLLPHEIEYRELYNSRKRIEKYANFSEVICISHYHYDHYTPFWDKLDNIWTFASKENAKKIYKNKQIFLKDPINNINFSQKKRAKFFVERVREITNNVKIADNKEINFGKTLIKFSQPVPHGEDNTPLGYVLMVLIKEKGEKLLFASDTEGPMSERSLKIIEKEKPDYLIISGPPLYLVKTKVSLENFNKGIENLKKITKIVQLLIVDHHLLRSEEALKNIKEIKFIAESKGSEVKTIAEKENKKIKMLEAKRDIIYKEKPPDEKFKEWLKKKTGLPPFKKL